MKKIHIKTVKPMQFEDKFLICIDTEWSRLFQDLAFGVDIVDGFLRIQSTEPIKDEHRRK